MDYRVTWTQRGSNDLEAIAGYIAKDSRHYASVFVKEIREAARTLTRFPHRGRIVPELDETSLHELLIGSYRLMYDIIATDVYIVALIHGARDLSNISPPLDIPPTAP